MRGIGVRSWAPMDTDQITTWLTDHGPGLLVGAVILFVLYRLAKPVIHRVVVSLLRVQQSSLVAGSAPAEELAKRASTLEELFGKLVRGLLVFAIFGLVLSAFDLWPLLAGLGLLAAALTLAGQDIVLDYLMGILILIEGHYYKGDWIAIRGPLGAVEGEVEDIGLRKTTIRDNAGTVHNVSNGLIRLSSNLTRVYSVASAEVQVLHAEDLDRTIEIAARVGNELSADPQWAEVLFDAPIQTAVTGLAADGVTVRVSRRVPPEARLKVASDLRRRLAMALAEAAIGTRRWDPSDTPGSGFPGYGAGTRPGGASRTRTPSG
jgi:moderate conductance mechanosensitive channel